MPIPYTLTFLLGDEVSNEDNRIVRLLKAWIGTLQPIEDTLQRMYSQKNVDAAVGAQLDLLGKLVGQGRGGLSDDDYRRYIRAKIVTNKSSGRFEDLIRVGVLIINDNTIFVQAHNEGAATIRLFITGVTTPALADILFMFEMRAKSAGVRLVLQWMESAEAGIFQLDAGPGFDVGHLSGDEG